MNLRVLIALTTFSVTTLACGSPSAPSPEQHDDHDEHDKHDDHDKYDDHGAGPGGKDDHAGANDDHAAPAAREVHLSAEAMAVSEIEVGTAERRIIAGGGAFPAEVAFSPAGTAHVSPIGAGRFARVDVSLGDKVEAGQVLAALVSSEVADLEGQLAQAKARLSGAEAELRRNARLVEDGVGAERGVVDARATVATLRAGVAGITKRLAIFGPQVAGQIELKAPISGIIAQIHAVIGESAGDEPAFTITDPTQLYVEAFVPELDIGKVQIGAAAIVRTHAFPDMALAGTVTSVAPSLDKTTRSLAVRVALT
ncbi:MAG: efflux RND transporter periplasmic adaptor subunit, partial [Deltaproteobacteria bacterium]|nr:efflux RND transporter periplasmic adaptor subunit [Deltaproteobacteria bacterium]